MMPYIINVALILAGCLAFYKVLLQKETFYKLNRYVLMICLMVSFSLPLLPVPQQWSLRKTEAPALHQPIQVTPVNQVKDKIVSPDPGVESPLARQAGTTETTNWFSLSRVMSWAIYLYWFGVIVFGLSFLVQVVVLIYRSYTNPRIRDGKFWIIEVSGDKAPCSFVNNIYINPAKYDWETYNQILQHEKVHIQQGHSLDLLLSELVLIFQWFNPFAWIYRKEVENNLEFLTDDQMVDKEAVEVTSYQMSLLKVTAPHMPLSVTTNYNQSLLKKRIAMMNAKKSNMHTAWKYFFLLPLLVLFASLLNEPVVYGQSDKNAENKKNEVTKKDRGIQTEGYWFATIRGEKVQIQFKQDEEDHNSYNGSDFLLSELGTLPRDAKGDFKLTREAGVMQFNGKFDGNQGMGRYKFVPNKDFGSYMKAEGVGDLDDEDLMTFFFVNVTKNYVQVLKEEGYKGFDKDELIPLAALKVDKAFIRGVKENGYKDVSLQDLIPLKALDITGAYISEIRGAGYKDISVQQLISFKSQGIDKNYLAKVPKLVDKKGNDKDVVDADDVIALKAMNIDEDFATSFKSVGLTDINQNNLIAMKSLGVTAEFVKSFHAAGFKDIEPDQLISLKSQNITPEFLKEFGSVGYKDLSIENIISMKAVGVTTEYIKSWQAAGFKNIDAQELIGLRSQNISPDYGKEFEAMGYKNIDPEDMVSLKATGVKPDFIKGFKDKGYANISLEDAIALKSMNITFEYIKSFEAVGFTNIPLHDVIALKSMRITPEWIKDMKVKGFNYDRIHKYITLRSIE